MKYNLLLIFFLFLTSTTFSQCPGGQALVTIDVATDSWGYECFWDLTPTGAGCGNGAFASFGNISQINCAGAGLQVATGGNGYGNNTTTTENLGCIAEGNCFDINYIDDYGDAGATFSVKFDGVTNYSFTSPVGTGSVFNFCVTLPALFDAEIHVTPFEYTKIPLSQVANIINSSSIVSNGIGGITGVAMNIVVLNGAATVFSENSSTQNISSGAAANYTTAGYIPTAVGTYTVVMAATMNETDEDPSNDLYAYIVEVTDSIYARDNGTKTGEIGIGAGEPGHIGAIFDMNNSGYLTSISALLGNTTGTITGQPIHLEIFSLDASGTPETLMAYATGTVSSTADQWHTLTVSPSIYLVPGGYLVSIREEPTYTQQIGYCDGVVTNESFWASWTSQPWATTEFLGFHVSLMLRANINTVAAIQSENIDAISIYPNPAHNTLQIKNCEEGTQIYILNNLGQIAMETKSLNSQLELNITDLSNGIYSIKLSSGQFFKFIKE